MSSSLYKTALANAKKQQEELRKKAVEEAKKATETKKETKTETKTKSGGKNKASGNTTLPTSNKKQGKSTLNETGKEAYEKAQAEYVVPKTIRNAAEGYINNSIPGTVNKMVTGKTLTDEINSRNPYNEQLHSGTAANVGQFVGAGVAFMNQSGLASPVTSKAAKAVSGTKLGKAVASKIGEGLTFGLAENAVDALTVGVAQNTAMAIGDRLTGKELLKDVAINTGADLLFGSAMEGVGAGLGKLADIRTSKAAEVKPEFKTTRGDLMSTETKTDIFNKIGERAGMTIKQDGIAKNRNGFVQAGHYNPDTKTAVINKNSHTDSFTTLKHELTHHLQSSNLYQPLSDFVFKGMSENGFDVEAIRAAKKADYEKALGRVVDPFEVDQEIVAEFCGEYLFNSEKSIERLARENPNLFQRIYDWIVDTIKKIGATDEQKFLIDAQRKYERVLDNVKKNPSTGGGEIDNLFVRANEDEIASALNVESKFGKHTAKEEVSAAVKKKTNLHKGFKDDWLYEINDKKATLNVKALKKKDVVKLTNLLEHDELYARLKADGVDILDEYRVVFRDDLPIEKHGWVDADLKLITLNSNFSNEEIKSSLLHEVQHLMQDAYNLPKGASYEKIKATMKGDDIDEMRKRLADAENDIKDKTLDLMKFVESKTKDKSYRQKNYKDRYDFLDGLTKYAEKNLSDEDFSAFEYMLGDIEMRLLDSENADNWLSDIAFEKYESVAGERESRDVSHRMNMSDRQRRNTMPDIRDENTTFVEDYYSIGKGSIPKNDSLLETSKTLYGEKGNRYLDKKQAPKTGAKPAPKTEAKAEPKKETKATPKKHKDLGADVVNPNAGMTYEEASKLMATHKHGTPKSLPAKGDVSQAADSILGSDFISEDLKGLIKDDIGNFVKTSKSNKVTLDNVYDTIKNTGIDESIGKLRGKIDSGAKITEEDIAMGMSLIEELDKRGRYEDALDVTGDLVAMLSQAGRTLQAARIYSKMTPYGRVKTIRKTVEKLEKAYDTKITLDENKLEQLFKETDDNKLNGLKRELMLDIWNQVPSTLMNKLDALRYTAMLSSPKTHLRNIFGNSFMAMGKTLSDAVEAGLEETIFKGKMEKMGAIRNKSMLNPFSESDRTLKKEAGELFEQVKDDILNQDVKYFENGSMSRPLGAKVFTGKNPVSKGAELARRAVSGSLEYEDELFMKLNFKSAFAQICKANGLTMQDLTAKELRAFTDYAVEQAQIATFRDSNKLADVFNKVYRMTTIKKGDSLGTKMGKTAGKIAMDATVPFKKTPANVLKQGWRYSPGGVFEGIFKCATAKDAKSLMEGIDALSNGIVGTPVMLAGAYLAKQGLVNGSLGQYSDKKTKYDKMTGKQDYAMNIEGFDLKLGDYKVTIGDQTITMDWMSPYSMPFFVGVEFGTSLMDSQLSGYELVDALASVTNPFFEMSMLQGLQTLMTTNYEENGVQTLIQNTMKSYIAQFIPAVSAQIAKTVAETTRTTSVKGDTSSGKFVASTKAQLYSKIPGLYEKNQEDVDLWGRTETKSSTTDYLQAGFRNIISPSNIKDMKVTAVDKEILRLYDALGEDGRAVIPNVANNNSDKLKYEGKEYQMTADEFTQYKKDVGQYRYKELQKLMMTRDYKTATNAQKADMIADVYSAANTYGKKQYLIKSGKVTRVDYDFNNLTEKRQEKYDSKQVDKKTYTTYMGKLDGNPSQEEAAKAITSMDGLTPAQKQYLWSVSSNRDPWKTSYADYIS